MRLVAGVLGGDGGSGNGAGEGSRGGKGSGVRSPTRASMIRCS